MKIWLPYVSAGTGSDISTHNLAAGLRSRGHDVHEQAFGRYYEFAPWLLKTAEPPNGCEAIITNTWNGFALARPGIAMVTVDRLFVLDPILDPYKSTAQRIYHHLLIQNFLKHSARAADQVVAVSEYTANTFARKLGLPRPKVILNAVDTEFFIPPRNPRRITQEQPRRLLALCRHLIRRVARRRYRRLATRPNEPRGK